jgi:hypothetical protein
MQIFSWIPNYIFDTTLKLLRDLLVPKLKWIKVVAEFEGKPIQRDRDMYPYTTVGENPGIVSGIELRSNYK